MMRASGGCERRDVEPADDDASVEPADDDLSYLYIALSLVPDVEQADDNSGVETLSRQAMMRGLTC